MDPNEPPDDTMNPDEPPDDPRYVGSTPTIFEGDPFEALLGEFDARDLAEARKYLDGDEEEGPSRLEALGPFRDLEEIGRGGMGVVYRAIHPETGRLVAVKVPAPGLMPTPAMLRQFSKEAEAVARLDHPGIVPHLPLASDFDQLFIVSDYCDGPDLEKWLSARNRPVTPREAARIVRDLADAVAHAHGRGVVHLDVKPSNVMLPGSTPDSHPDALSPRLTDFGLAKLMDDGESPMATATRTGMVMGSPPYMAPEQAAGRRSMIARPTDVYGLGAVLYELLTGRPPFRGESAVETLGMVMVVEPVPVRVLRPGIPRSLENIVLQCLDKEPGGRYATADALRDDLDAFLAGRRVRARRPGPVERARRWARRRPKSAWLAASALLLAVVLAAGFASWTVALSRGRDRAEQHAYASRVQLARRAYETGHLSRAQLNLHGLIPQDGERDRREFAWRHLWELTRREARMIFGAEAGFDHLALSPDGSKLVHGGAAGVSLKDLNSHAVGWWVSTGAMVLNANPAFSRDGRKIVLVTIEPEDRIGRTRAVEIRDASDGTLLGRRVLPASVLIRSASIPREGHLRLIVHVPAADAPFSGEIWTWSDHGPLDETAPPVRFPVLCAVSADGRRALVIDDEGRMAVHDLAAQAVVPLRDAPVVDLGVCNFSADGRRVCVSRERDVELAIHDTADGRLLQRISGFDASIAEASMQPGGDAVALRTVTQEVRLVDPSRGLNVRVLEAPSGSGVESKHIQFTPDGTAFLVHRTEHQGTDRIELRSAEDGRLLAESPARHTGLPGPWALRHGPRPELIYSQGLYAWRWEWGRSVDPGPEDMLKGHDDEAWALAYSPDGKLLGSSSNNDREEETIRLRMPDGRIVREWRDSEATVSGLVFSPDGSWIATAHLCRERAIRIRPSLDDGEVVSVELPDGEWGRSVAVDPTRPVVYAGGDRGTVLAWDVASRRVLWRIMPPPERRLPRTHDRVHQVAISPDGRRLAVADDRGVVRLLDTANGDVVASHEGRGPMLAVAYAPDGRTVAAGDREGLIYFLDAGGLRPRQVVPGDDRDLRCLAFSPDGRTLAAAGLGQVVRLWDPSTGEELLSLPGHRAQVNAVAFSPDGETLASADHVGIIRFWRGPLP